MAPEDSNVTDAAHGKEKASSDSIGSLMNKILKTSIPNTTTTPILIKRKAIERQIEEVKLDKRARQIVKQELRAARDSAHKPPQASNEEKAMRKFATTGVVQLFNAVHQHQVKRDEKQNAIKKAEMQKQASTAQMLPVKSQVKNMSKSSFLELLKMGGGLA